MKAMQKTGEKTIKFDINAYKSVYTLGNGRKIAFDTGDMNLPYRLLDAIEAISAYFDAKREEYGINSVEDVKKMSTGDLREEVNRLKEHDAFVRDKINRALNAVEPEEDGFEDICAAAFGTANCVNVNRETGSKYYEDFLEAIYPIIEAEYGVVVTALEKQALKEEKAVSKYTSQKGKHSK